MCQRGVRVGAALCRPEGTKEGGERLSPGSRTRGEVLEGGGGKILWPLNSQLISARDHCPPRSLSRLPPAQGAKAEAAEGQASWGSTRGGLSFGGREERSRALGNRAKKGKENGREGKKEGWERQSADPNIQSLCPRMHRLTMRRAGRQKAIRSKKVRLTYSAAPSAGDLSSKISKGWGEVWAPGQDPRV